MEFYENVSRILKIDHTFSQPVRKRNRWNTRKLGNGRYSGFGLVQCFGSSVRVVTKQGTKIFRTYEETYEYLARLVELVDTGDL